MPKIPGSQIRGIDTEPASLSPPQRDNLIFPAAVGVDTSAARTDIQNPFAFDIQNLCPIGNGNLLSIPNISAVLNTYLSTPFSISGQNLKGTEYVAALCADGSIHLYNISAQSDAVINVPMHLSGAGSQCCMWENSTMLFIDSTGYYSWDGSTFMKITGTGVPSSGDTIEVYDGRVWISQGRTVFFSGAGGFDSGSVSGTNYWLPANGAGFTVITDPKMRASKLTGMHQANGLLFLYHQTGVNVISNVNVPLGLIPPTPNIENDNIEAVSGCDQPDSIVPFDIYDIYASRSGPYEMYGVTLLPLGARITGTWKYVDFTQPVTAGQFVLNGSQWGAYCFSRLNDPDFGSGYTIACFSQSGQDYKWWFINYPGPVNRICTGWVNGTPSLFGLIGNQLFQLMGDPTTAPPWLWRTQIAPMEDPLAQKETLQCGFQADFFGVGPPGGISLAIETETQSQLVPNLQLPTLVTGPYQRYFPNAGVPNMGGRSVGLNLSSTGGWPVRIRLLAIDYMERNRWGQP